MATGSGTGTPVTGAAAFTLTTLRERIRTMIMHASGFTEPMVLTASSETLATLRDRVELKLQDSGNTRWAEGDLDEAIQEALEQYTRRNPQEKVTTLELSADGREIDVSSITDLWRIERVWFPYDSASPSYPPNWVQFESWAGDVLFIDEPTEPASGQVARIFYTAKHTINGLNGASATTVPEEDITYIISGAAHFAAQMRAVELSEDLNVDKDVVNRLKEWATEQGKNYRYGVAQRPPAWQRYAYAYDQDDLDEAVNWALGRYNEINPERTITTLTLSAAGREIDVSSITDYLDILQVWWPYTSSSPEHPPYWRNFEVWPGDVLFLDVDGEPQSGDAVRIWYTRSRTINGLASASATTVPADHETLLATGASGFAAQERVQEQPGYFVPTKLREWANARLREFERGLRALSRREAAKHSGISTMAPLDRWDHQDGDW